MNKSNNDHINIKALIVEDEIDICYLLSGILKKRNFVSRYVTSIRDAEKTLSREHPSIIFLDNHLPDGNGVDIISLIKKDHPETKIVMITAHDTIHDKEKALSRGADVFLGKPFTQAAIYSTLDVLFSKTA